MLRSIRCAKNVGTNLISRPVSNEIRGAFNVNQRTNLVRLSSTWFGKWAKSHEDLLRNESLIKLGSLNRIIVRNYASLPPHSRIDLPALSPTMKTGSVLTWEKKEGEKLNEGDLLCEIETDKATMGFETPEEGYLAKILISAGTRDIPIGKLLCIIVQDESSVAAFKDFKAEDAPSKAPAAAAPAPSAPAPVTSAPPPAPTAPTSRAAPTAAPVRAAGARVFASPLAKKIASERGVDLASIAGTGPNGRIVAKDVLGAPAGAGRAFGRVTSTSPYTDIPLTGMRQTIAARLLESKQTIPHYYLQVDIVVDEVVKARETFNELLADEGLKISVNDFVIKASALACQHVPEVNSSWQGSYIRQYNSVDVNVAVSTDGGLIAPIVFQAEQKGLRDIGAEVKALADKAKQGRLQPNEFQGGTFTVSNLGMFGVKNFSAVINPPQSCILAVGTVTKQVIGCKETGQPKVANVLSVTLSCDHRVVDGAVGAKWLQIFKQYMEQPATMIL